MYSVSHLYNTFSVAKRRPCCHSDVDLARPCSERFDTKPDFILLYSRLYWLENSILSVSISYKWFMAQLKRDLKNKNLSLSIRNKVHLPPPLLLWLWRRLVDTTLQCAAAVSCKQVSVACYLFGWTGRTSAYIIYQVLFKQSALMEETERGAAG